MSELNQTQLEAVASWFAAGASLDEIQKRLRAEYDVHMTYLDLRLLVADLPQPKEPEPPKKAPAPPPPAAPKGMDEAPLPGPRVENAQPPPADDLDVPADDPDAGLPDVAVELDALTIPGTIASGDVTFSDGTKGKWYVDRAGRLGLGNCPPGYQPSRTDAQVFQTKLMDLLQSRGLA